MRCWAVTYTTVFLYLCCACVVPVFTCVFLLGLFRVVLDDASSLIPSPPPQLVLLLAQVVHVVEEWE